MSSSRPVITLTAHEEEIVAVLLEAAKPIPTAIADNVDADKQTQLVVRIAGGWVRDKLLGFESDDIDVALENCSGIEFANRVNATLNRLGYEEHKIGLIMANPAQSKHLETANVRILGTFVDCVNLRSEVYAEDSRIPEIKFGSAEEDAMRRDFTINSMFYNIHTRLIEDYSGNGLKDLARRVIQTPLPALVTFKDDPLRVLRAIRFASRYDYSFEDDLIVAASSPMIRKALVEKISRERILVELDSMLAGSRCRPPAALWSIFALDLFDTVFNPTHGDDIAIEPDWTVYSSLVVCVINALIRMVYFDDINIINKEFMTFQTVSSSFSPFSPSDMTAADVITAKKVETVFQKKGLESPQIVEIPSNILYSHLSSLVISNMSCPREEQDAIYEDLMMTHRLVYLAASVSGLRGIKCREVSVKDQQHKSTEGNDKTEGKKKQNHQQASREAKTILLSTHTLRQLKLDTKSTKAIETILTGANFVRDFVKRNGNALIINDYKLERCGEDVEGVALNVDDAKMREELGMFVREMKQVWKCAVIYACAVDIIDAFDRSLFKSFASQALDPPKVKILPANLTSENCSSVNRIEDSEQLEIIMSMDLIMKYVMVSRLVHIYKLEEAWTIRPLFDSKSIGSELGIKQGPQIGVVIEEAVRWQLRNPQGNGQELMKFLKDEGGNIDDT